MRGVAGFVLLILVTLLLRSTALAALAGRGIVIDVLVLATIVWSLRNGESSGTTFGFFLGLAADIDAAHWPGRHALALVVLGYLVGRLSHTLVRESARTQVALLAFGTLLHQLWTTAFEMQGIGSWPYLLQRVVLATLVTAPLGALLLAIARRLGGRGLFVDATAESNSTP
jgi:rod shape-determining protein MreD